MAPNNKSALTNLLRDLWSEGKVEMVETYIAENYTIRHDPGDPWHGQTLDREGYRNRLLASREPFPDQKFQVVEMVAEGDKVAVSWMWEGTHKGNLGDIPATGKVIKMSGLTIYSFEGGKASGHWQIIDRLSVYRQLAGQPE